MTCWVCSIILLVVAIVTPTIRRQLRSEHAAIVSSLLCHITMEYVSTDASLKLPPEHFLTCSPVESGEVSDYAYPIHLSSDFIDKNQEDLLGGTLFVEIADAKIIDGSVVHNEDSLIVPTSAPESFQLRRRRLAAIDTRSVLVLRINAKDTSPYFTASEIYDFVFNETEPTLRSQYRKLSFGKLNFVPTDYGVMDIDVNLNAKGSSTAVIRDAAIAVVAAQARVSSIKALADHVMFCLPPGTGNWAGSSPVNSWRIVLNNKWCGYLSGMMHEMGHNLGLLVSRELAYLSPCTFLTFVSFAPGRDVILR